jgi:hypothetical protein
MNSLMLDIVNPVDHLYSCTGSLLDMFPLYIRIQDWLL